MQKKSHDSFASPPSSPLNFYRNSAPRKLEAISKLFFHIGNQSKSSNEITGWPSNFGIIQKNVILNPSQLRDKFTVYAIFSIEIAQLEMLIFGSDLLKHQKMKKLKLELNLKLNFNQKLKLNLT